MKSSVSWKSLKKGFSCGISSSRFESESLRLMTWQSSVGNAVILVLQAFLWMLEVDATNLFSDLWEPDSWLKFRGDIGVDLLSWENFFFMNVDKIGFSVDALCFSDIEKNLGLSSLLTEVLWFLLPEEDLDRYHSKAVWCYSTFDISLPVPSSSSIKSLLQLNLLFSWKIRLSWSVGFLPSEYFIIISDLALERAASEKFLIRRVYICSLMYWATSSLLSLLR